ncbi:nitroreductase family protein [Mucisphaera calidilacus]|uniref:NAD(P)H nitroreductase YodC n=1 Tax=Mucisphaera calidilacus TaxID=2527982 RepID=A0A518BTW3_9BACT|nr:nitroreductase family protein [Mucisphaera calidilacus]QDU70397.1 Putative NAD(P)H nitroreductase YodC [Mucisphaera calidilacus]
MDTFEAIYQRRAVKHYDPAQDMSDDDERKLMEAALQSPTSFNIQNWRFVVVRDKARRALIREAAWDQAQVTDASILVVVCADLRAWDREPERYWRNAPEAARDMLVPMIKPFYAENAELQRDEAMRSCGLGAMTLMLAAKAMGYDSCPMIGFDPARVAEIIELPEDHVIGMLLPIGKAAKPAWPKPGQLPLDEVVIRETF